MICVFRVKPSAESGRGKVKVKAEANAKAKDNQRKARRNELARRDIVKNTTTICFNGQSINFKLYFGPLLSHTLMIGALILTSKRE